MVLRFAVKITQTHKTFLQQGSDTVAYFSSTTFCKFMTFSGPSSALFCGHLISAFRLKISLNLTSTVQPPVDSESFGHMEVVVGDNFHYNLMK